MDYKRMQISLPAKVADELDIAAGNAYKTRSEFLKDLVLYHLGSNHQLTVRGSDIERMAEKSPDKDRRQIVEEIEGSNSAFDAPEVN